MCGGMVPCLSSSDAHVDFKMIDGTLNNRSYFISAVPFIGIMLDTGEYTYIHVFISISCSSTFGGTAGIFTITDPAFIVSHFRTDSFDTA